MDSNKTAGEEARRQLHKNVLRAILNKSWQQHPTRHQLYGHLPPITKTIQVRRTRHAGHCWRSRDELISDVLLWTPTHGRAKAGRPARTYIQQLCEDTGRCPEDLPEAMNDREKWQERVRDIRATSMTWLWLIIIWLIDGSLARTTTPIQSESESNGNEGIFHFYQSSRTGVWPSDGLVSCSRHLLTGSYFSAEMQSAYSTVPTDWVGKIFE